ncbi:MAG: tRNA lysidine(34) synthetase TilS [Candidatus Aminicenantales bacterium]|jgi:tRNA(Ile)-lysidine synthase
MSKTRKGRVFQAFKTAVLKHGMIVPGDRVLAACSGGPDSVALTSLLLKLRNEMPLEVSVAHFNHRIRPEAKDDEAFVRELTRSWALPLITGSKEVRREAQRRKINLEEAARVLRYEFLRRAARKSGATKIATGHTMNDQAETFLMRLFRGTGLPGLAGIEPVSGPAACPVIRPLLGLRREELEAYLREEGLGFRTDESNLDRRFLRNRVRLGLLPEVERDYGPRIVEHLATLSSLIREEEALLAGMVRAFAEEFITRSGGEAALDVRTLSLLPPALARRVLREFIRELKGDLRAVSFEDIESVLGLRDGKEKTVKKGLVLRREKGRLFRLHRRAASRGFETTWNGEGEISAGGMTFMGQMRDRADGLPLKGDDTRQAVVDLAKLRFPLEVRNRRPGDLYRPLGAPGRKKLKEILRAKGIARDDRDRLPVFLSRGEIVWVPGLPVAEGFKVRAGTRRVFSIERMGPGRRAQRR